MASSASTSMASVEPAVHTNSTGGNEATSSAAASQTLADATEPIVIPTTMEQINVIYYNGYRYIASSSSGTLYRWKCESARCPAFLRTRYINCEHVYESADVHWENAHNPRSGGGAATASTLRDAGKRKAVPFADKPPATVSGVAQTTAKKRKGGHLPIGGAVMASDTLHSQETPPEKAEDAAADNSKIESTKGSGAGNLVDSRAAAVRPCPVHVQHSRGSNEPWTSALPSGDQGVQESEIIPPPFPPAGADPADTAQNDADDGDDSYFISFDDSMNEDIGENPGAAILDAGDGNSQDGEADGRGSPDPPSQIASYERTGNAGNAADDSAGIPLTMRGLNRSQTVRNINPQTGDLRERELREILLRLQIYLAAKQLEIENLRVKLLNPELYSNRADKQN